MQKIKLLALTFFMLGAMAVTAQDNIMKKSLYDRLGGLPAIKAVIDDYVARVAADDRVNKKFGKSDIPRVKLHLVEQVCAATGGPCTYTGLDMKKSHKNMKVTEGEFGALVEDLVATLDKFNVPKTEKDELLGILGPLKSQIVEVNSAETGTPLPANFKPAPKLSNKRIAAGPMIKKAKGKM
jgi:hemoglobin